MRTRSSTSVLRSADWSIDGLVRYALLCLYSGPRVRLSAPHGHERDTRSVDGAGMIEAASDSGTAQVVAPNDGSVIDALRHGDEGAFAEPPARDGWCRSLASTPRSRRPRP